MQQEQGHQEQLILAVHHQAGKQQREQRNLGGRQYKIQTTSPGLANPTPGNTQMESCVYGSDECLATHLLNRLIQAHVLRWGKRKVRPATLAWGWERAGAACGSGEASLAAITCFRIAAGVPPAWEHC